MADDNASAEQAEEKAGYNTWRAALLAGVAALGGFLFGFDTAVINGAVDALADDFALGALLKGFSVSTALLGAAAGAFLAGRIADRIGRTRVMVLAAALFLVSAIGTAFSFGPADLIVWRIVGGLGVGAASVIAPAYIAEIAPAPIRGRLGSLFQMAIVSGILIALASDLAIAGLAGSAGEEWIFGISAWRWMFLVEVIPAAAFGILALTIPESPRYLIANDREDEARDVLGQVLKGGLSQRIAEIHRTVRQEKKSSFSDLRKSGSFFLPVVWVGLSLALLQQLVGINVIFYYSTTLWQSVGFNADNALLYSVVTGVVNVAVTIVAILLIDKVGRRRLLLVGSVGMALSLGTLAVVFGTAAVNDAGEPALTDASGLIALVAANLFVVFFGVSWGPVMWVMLGEMFNNTIRAAAIGLAGTVNWLANFFVSTTFPTFSDRLGLGFTYGFYTFFAGLSFFFVLRFVDETNGKELEDMTDDSRSRQPREPART